MLDIETLSLAHNAVLLSIGAVKFDPNAPLDNDGKHQLLDAFYVVIDPKSSQRHGLHLDASTVMWWMHEDRTPARAQLMLSQMHDLPTALEAFKMWYGHDSLPTWGKGADFDSVVMKGAYAALGETPPWSYKDVRCHRTMCALAPEIPVVDVGTAHQALDDATAQAFQLQDIARHLGITL